MVKYIDADLLRKEIEFAKSVYDNPKRVVHGVADAFMQDGRAAMCEDILKKIDSLQQEQPEVDLEKEIETYFKGWYMDETDQGYILHTPDDHAGLMSVKQIARHFAKWGAENLKV